jgi:hypothetical protein
MSFIASRTRFDTISDIFERRPASTFSKRSCLRLTPGKSNIQPGRVFGAHSLAPHMRKLKLQINWRSSVQSVMHYLGPPQGGPLIYQPHQLPEQFVARIGARRQCSSRNSAVVGWIALLLSRLPCKQSRSGIEPPCGSLWTPSFFVSVSG